MSNLIIWNWSSWPSCMVILQLFSQNISSFSHCAAQVRFLPSDQGGSLHGCAHAAGDWAEHWSQPGQGQGSAGQPGPGINYPPGISPGFLFPLELSLVPVLRWWVMTEWPGHVWSPLLYGQMINNFEESSLLPPFHFNCMIYRRILVVGHFSFYQVAKTWNLIKQIDCDWVNVSVWLILDKSFSNASPESSLLSGAAITDWWHFLCLFNITGNNWWKPNLEPLKLNGTIKHSNNFSLG